jgi:uncharacterized membrane protein YkvA (DUF1232 family)
MTSIMKSLKQKAIQLKLHIYALYLASKHSATPMSAKLITVLVVAYALSPIDLIPDFIPIIGFVDDVLLLPIGIWLAIKLIPDAIWLSCKQHATRHPIILKKNPIAAVLIVSIWLLSAYLIITAFSLK